ncbi:hypothetical protein AURANDRAFT_66148 [Aureococcus anophagefferens]|uniref:BART domain-containing protein n=1 Tax=Aureococcus anophagefferens TaxID=44056 RepID=F0YGI5_AURAN|nr:hypothetical protein AURANDRAFT_66148 [Aureococcus anophagefferens]EGB05789.1 hypothetical protein AURANDRAFT_66148 [Aureococcus anophagefferens]|eukprot:XP_009039627.1 hypothetical protein AURANDRAFT_66148 [Aureococcus anophagefferens]
MGDAVIDLEFDDPVVLKLFQQIVCNQEVADRFVAFFSQHRHKFVGASLDGEQKLEYTAVFDEYSALYDEILGAAPAPAPRAASTTRLAGDVVKETGCSTEEIADRCRGAMGKKGGAGARRHAFFLNAILAASSYERFLDTMLFVPEDEAKDAKGESKDDYADAKDVHVADAKDAK